MNAQRTLRSSGDLLADRRYRWAEAALAENDAAAAAELLAQAIAIAPAFAPAWMLSGKAWAALGDRDGASDAFREVLRLDPQDAFGAGIELAVLGVGRPGAAISPAYVRALFDDYASRFDEHLTGDLAYCAPALIMDALRDVRVRQQKPFHFARALDLGCGTGLMGEALRPFVDRLDGCDLAPMMIAKARAKSIYDALAVADMAKFLDGEGAASADLVVAADVFVYAGDLKAIFAAAARARAPDGLLAFTVESHERDGFGIGEDRRYHHSESYLRDLARRHGFRVGAMRAVATRVDRAEPVPGLVAVMAQTGTP